jgi:hypothetical protein
MALRRAKWLTAGVAAVIALIGLILVARSEVGPETLNQALRAGGLGCSQVHVAFAQHATGEWLTMRGVVQRVLPDSHGASSHQRFVLECGRRWAGQTVLIVNNVDVGSRATVETGDSVIVHGMYIWNRLGGLIHYTHHSTDSNQNGWVESHDHVYQ